MAGETSHESPKWSTGPVDESGADQAIAALLTSYQAAVRTGNREGFADVFHADATVSYPDPDSGRLVTVSAEAFADEVVALVVAGETVEEVTRAGRVDVGGDVAVARVDFSLQIGADHFEGTDFLALARIGAQWQITQKLYTMRPVPASRTDRVVVIASPP